MSSPGFSFSQAHLAEIATDILKHAKKHGASACETDVSEGFGQSVAVRKGEVDTIEYNRDKGVGVTVYVGQQRGYASTSDFSKKALKATVDAALSIARFTAPDPCAGLADAALISAGVLGMAQALGRHPAFAQAMALAGALFLAWYGWQALQRARHASQLQAAHPATGETFELNAIAAAERIDAERMQVLLRGSDEVLPVSRSFTHLFRE